jgi:hypothetical protein
MKKALVIALVVIEIVLSGVIAAKAQDRPYEVWLPFVSRLPVYEREDDVYAYADLSNLEAAGQILITVHAPGCSWAEPNFRGIDRDIFPPSVYYQWCINNPTTGASVLIFVYSPMEWDGWSIEVHYPNGFLQTINIPGHYKYDGQVTP